VCWYANSISDVTDAMRKCYGWEGGKLKALRRAYWEAGAAYKYNAGGRIPSCGFPRGIPVT
jgi:hypothetical protein